MYSYLNTHNHKIKKKNGFFQMTIKHTNIFTNTKSYINNCLDDIFYSIYHTKPLPCFFLSYKFTYNGWELFCEPDFMALSLCEANPYKKIILEIKILKQLLLSNNFQILPIHLSLTIYHNSQQLVHANTLVLDGKGNLVIFEPKSTINNLVPGFKNFFFKSINQIAKKTNLNLRGYINPYANFQGINNDLCYLWTSWFEIICLLNHKRTITELTKFIKNIFLQIGENNHMFINSISNYIKEFRFLEL